MGAKIIRDDEKAAVLFTELLLSGMIEFSRSGEEYTLTNKGADYAIKEWEKLDDRLKVMFPIIIIDIFREFEEGN